MREKKVEKIIKEGRIKNVKSVLVHEKCLECGAQLIIHEENLNPDKVLDKESLSKLKIVLPDASHGTVPVMTSPAGPHFYTICE